MAGQSHADGLCLRYPEALGPQPNLTGEMAVNLLIRAVQLAHHTPFVWGYIDRPQEGQMFIIFLTPQLPFPPDGIRYQEQEQKALIPAGPGRELEVMEVKYGFLPNSSDGTAWRVRRRFRLIRGGHQQLVLIHYGRGNPIPIIPSLNQPVRAYPLRAINEPAVFVLGDKTGQKVYPNAGAPIGMGERQPSIGFGAGMGAPANPQALLAQQNSNLEALERRNRSGSMSARPAQPQPRIEEDDSADESDMISTRTLALTRYRRNHELMNEVFMFAAFGQKEFPEPPTPYSIFNKADLEAKMAKLSADVEELKSKTEARRQARSNAEAGALGEETGDISMESLGASGEMLIT